MSAAATLSELLRSQAQACGQLGSPLYRDLLARAAADVESGGPAWELLRGHEADARGSALALRLMGAVHRLVLAGELPALGECYDNPEADPGSTWAAFASALSERKGTLRRLLDLPVQTNEVGRCAALLMGFVTVAERTGLPLRLLELGASAGLNLRWDRYRYEAGRFRWGPETGLRIAFELSGEPSAPRAVSVAERRGCDPAPVDAGSEAGSLTLLSYLWPDQRSRIERTIAALEVARQLPVTVDCAGAAEWLGPRLAEPRPGHATVVFHSIVMQYLDPGEREAVASMLARAGENSGTGAPLAWLRMEPAGERAELRLTLWPDGAETLLGSAGYHGDPVELR